MDNMSNSRDNANHYSTLNVHYQAAQSDIKRAYRHLVKKFHPDCNHHLSSHDRIAAINIAYEVLSNPQSRAFYDRSIGIHKTKPVDFESVRSHKTANYVDEDQKLEMWFEQVYTPIIAILNTILDDLDDQIDDLAADPFDDELMGNFQVYLDECRGSFTKAQILFRGLSNPKSAAGVAAYLYHCLNQVGDGIEELNYFTLNFDDHHLHTGQEHWRIAEEMRSYAQTAMNTLAI